MILAAPGPLGVLIEAVGDGLISVIDHHQLQKAAASTEKQQWRTANEKPCKSAP